MVLPGSSHECSSPHRRNTSPMKPKSTDKQLRQRVQQQQQQSQTKILRVRQPVNPPPEHLTEEHRAILQQKLQNNHKQQTNNSQQNSQNEPAEQAQNSSNVPFGDFAIPSSGMEIDSRETEYESSSSNYSDKPQKKTK